MLTIAQATAIISVLMAFGVDNPTILKIHDILIPPEVVVTPVQVIQTPIVKDQPVQFGSVAVSTPPPATSPVENIAPPVVIQSVPMDTPVQISTMATTLESTGRLLVETDKLINASATTFSNGITYEVMVNGPDFVAGTGLHRKSWFPDGLKTSYVYVFQLTGAFNQQFTMTIQDEAGTPTTKTFN